MATIRFDAVSTEQGLSQGTVRAILQDQQGFMWFATEDGLNQYDGYHFTVFKHDPDDSTSLSNDLVTALYESQNGTLWVGTSTGPDRFDRKTKIFIHYPQSPDDFGNLAGEYISAIVEDKSCAPSSVSAASSHS